MNCIRCAHPYSSLPTIKAELGAKNHAALDKNAKARRLLARTVLTSWTLHPAPGFMTHTPAKDIWELGDFEMVIVCRNVSPAGFISDKVMLAECVPSLQAKTHGSTSRIMSRLVYFCVD